MTLLACAWSPPPANLVLSHDEIHVWRASLDQPLSQVEQLMQTLSADERAWAERYYFAHDKQHFVVARSLLRSILGRYIDIEPSRLQFCAGPYGKPALVETSSRYVPRFNLSHSHGLALYVFTRDQEVGVDLEYVRPVAEEKQIAERYFAVQERNILRNLPPDELYKQFFTYWTRMEAYLKACGDGLTRVEEYRAANPSSIPSNWSIESLIPAPGYIGALAMQERDIRIVYYRWEL